MADSLITTSWAVVAAIIRANSQSESVDNKKYTWRVIKGSRSIKHKLKKNSHSIISLNFSDQNNGKSSSIKLVSYSDLPRPSHEYYLCTRLVYKQ